MRELTSSALVPQEHPELMDGGDVNMENVGQAPHLEQLILQKWHAAARG